MSEELADMLGFLRTDNPRYWLIFTNIIMHQCFKEDWKAFLNPYEERFPLMLETAIVDAMLYIVSKPKILYINYIKKL